LFSRNGSICAFPTTFETIKLLVLSNVCSFQRTKSPQRNHQMPQCVVRYVACGNLKHTLKVEKRSNPQPRGRADPERQVLGAEATGETSETTALE